MDVAFQQLLSCAMEQLNAPKTFKPSEEEDARSRADSTTEASAYCEETITRSSSSASSSSTGCVFEGSEIMGEDADAVSVGSPASHHACVATYLSLGMGEYNGCSHDDSGFRTETDESLCRTVSSCDLALQDPIPAPKRPQELSTNSTETTTSSSATISLPDNPIEGEAPSPRASTPVSNQQISSEGPTVLVENLDTPSSTSSCDDVLIANGQCSSHGSTSSHSCSSSRDSGLSSMAELDTSATSNRTPGKTEAPTKSEQSSSAPGSCGTEVATGSTSAGTLKSQEGLGTSTKSTLDVPNLNKSHHSGQTTGGSSQDQETLTGTTIANRLRPQMPLAAPNSASSTSQQYSICSGNCCLNECSTSLG